MSVIAVVPEFGGSVEVNANAAEAEVEVAPVAAEVESVAASASRLAGETGQNSAEFQTKTSVGRIDLTGKAHYDKAAGTKIETPHVHEQQIHTSPTGQTNLGAKTTRPATPADVEKARQIIKKDPQ